MTVPRHIAVIDIGKTNAKLALVALSDCREIAVRTQPNTVFPGPPYPHFDVEGHWRFLLAGLAELHRAHGIDAISVTTHGACVALLDGAGELACPVLDYEFELPPEATRAYDRIRPAFATTGSPRLAGGLNLGAQLHWLLSRDPALLSRVKHVVTYPQFWGARLTGKTATDVTSLGCHTDLWEPATGQFSPLVDALGLRECMARPMASARVLGRVLPEIAAQTGLSKETPVHVGIHDSNASLLPHLRSVSGAFSVVSTGTWVICMSVQGKAVTLDPTEDTLINVNAFGDPVPSARFMGGREFELALQGHKTPVTAEAEQSVLGQKTMLMPSLAPESGPFQGREAHWIGEEPALGSAERMVAISFYLALMTETCLARIGHQGSVLVEGPFAANRNYLRMVSVLTDSPVLASNASTGTAQGAALLAVGAGADVALERPTKVKPPQGAERAALAAYGAAWQGALAKSAERFLS